MIIRQTPKNIEEYFKLNNDISVFLQSKNIHPLYMDNNYFYFKKDKITEKFLKKYYEEVDKSDEGLC